VLLPGLPLQMWNSKALEVVGNSIGRFIKVDETTLRSPDKRMAKVLVEVDVHVGLLEVLEIEWRGLLFVQRLDYLGLPFRCTVCRRTGHLRKECPNIFGSLVEEDSTDEMPGDSVTPLEDAQDPVDYPGLSSEESPVASDHTFVGKLKYYCPQAVFFFICMGA
jgi:hypothetical protein